MEYSEVKQNDTKISWLDIKWLRFMKEEPDNVLFKNNFEEEFMKMKIRGVESAGDQREQRNCEKQPISQAKKKELLNLCKTKVISADYHDLYKN